MAKMKPRMLHRPLAWLAKKILFYLATKKRIMCNNLVCRRYADNSIIIDEEDGVKYYCKRCMNIILVQGYIS